MWERIKDFLSGILPGIGDAFSNGWDGFRSWIKDSAAVETLINLFTKGPMGLIQSWLGLGGDDQETANTSKMDDGLEKHSYNEIRALARHFDDANPELSTSLRSLADIANAQFQSGALDFTTNVNDIDNDIADLQHEFMTNAAYDGMTYDQILIQKLQSVTDNIEDLKDDPETLTLAVESAVALSAALATEASQGSDPTLESSEEPAPTTSSVIPNL
ncbi:MAG: hypothetical protein AAF182_01670 [Pseudomonadota bacterium]